VFDYLAKPFQRSTKYGLLLRDLLKETPESHPDFAAAGGGVRAGGERDERT
jgi:hypothetical protein